MNLTTQRKQLQTQLTELATTEKFEKRKRDLPYTRPSQAKLSYIKKQRTEIKERLSDITEYEAKNYQLKTGEWINKTDYNKLDKEAKAYLNEHGIAKYNKDYVSPGERLAKVEEAKFKRENIQLDNEEWVSKEFYQRLSSSDKRYLNKHGVAKFNKYKEAEYKRTTVLLDTGERVDKEFYNELDQNAKDYLNRFGVTQFIGGYDAKHNRYWGYLGVQKWLADELDKNWLQVGGSWIRKTDWAAMSQYAKDYIKKFGMRAYNEMYIPAQRWLYETTTKKLEAQEAALLKLKPYYEAGTVPEGITNPEFVKYLRGLAGYNLLAAWEGGISENTLLAAGFSKEAIAEMKAHKKTLSALKTYTDSKGRINLIEALADKAATDNELKAIGITDKAITEARQELTKTVILAKWGIPIPARLVPATAKAALIEVPKMGVGIPKLTEVKIAGTAYGGFVVGLIPVVGTVVYWNKMTPTMRAISIALDILILAPFARVAMAAVRQDVFAAAKMGTLKGSRAMIGRDVIQLAQAENVATKTMASYIGKAYGKTVAKYYTTMMNAQLRYMTDLAKVARLRKTGAADKMIDRAVKVAQASERDLVVKAKEFTKSTRGKAGFDDSRAAKLMNDIPQDITRNTRSAVDSLTTPKATIKTLEQQVRKAEATLKAAKEKYHDPKDWVDLLADLMEKQGKLIQARFGDVRRLQALLIEARTSGTIEGFKLAEKLQKQLDAAIKSLQIEAAKGGFLSYGHPGIDVPVVKPWTGLISGEKPRVEGISTERGTQAMREKEARAWGIETLPPAISKILIAPTRRVKISTRERTTFETPAPEIKALPTTRISLSTRELAAIQMAIVSKAVTLPAMVTAPKTGAKEWVVPSEAVRAMEAVQVKAYTAAAIMAATQAATKAAMQNMTEAQVQARAKAATMPMLKAITSVQVKTAVKLAVKTALPIRVKIPIKIPLPSGKTRQLTKKEAAGVIAWKQGFMYKLLYPPYGEKQIVNTRKPISGVKYHRGVGSAYKSIIAKGGIVPRVVRRDMGVVDVIIKTPPKSRKPRISFKSDRKQRTTTTPGISGVR